MTKKYDGGPAFPTTEFYDEKPIGSHPGMSLRDDFAGRVIIGIASNIDSSEMKDLANGIVGGTFMARAAYVLADAMLKARNEA